MNMGTLATIAHQAPANYCLIIVDNKAYGSTGNQPTCTAQKTDLAAVARGAGNREVKRVKSIVQLRTALRLLKNKSSIIVAETDCSAEPAPVIPLTPLQIRDRFMGKIRK